MREGICYCHCAKMPYEHTYKEIIEKMSNLLKNIHLSQQFEDTPQNSCKYYHYFCLNHEVFSDLIVFLKFRPMSVPLLAHSAVWNSNGRIIAGMNHCFKLKLIIDACALCNMHSVNAIHTEIAAESRLYPLVFASGTRPLPHTDIIHSRNLCLYPYFFTFSESTNDVTAKIPKQKNVHCVRYLTSINCICSNIWESMASSFSTVPPMNEFYFFDEIFKQQSLLPTSHDWDAIYILFLFL